MLSHDPAWKITSTRIKNNCRMVATIEPKKRHRLTCSKCGALAIPHSYTQREQCLASGIANDWASYLCVRKTTPDTL